MLRALGAAAFVAATITPLAAAASSPLKISGNFSFDDVVKASEVIVEDGGVLQVKPFNVPDQGNPNQVGKGYVHIQATSIWVKSGGTITADEAGFQGLDGKDGGGPGAGKMATILGPGGGAGYGGAGGPGTDNTCAALMGYGIPGQPYASAFPMGVPPLGSSGGAALVSSGDGGSSLSRGGHGGGAIFLEAGTIRIDGAVTANGGAGSFVDLKGGGGGSGGAIYVRANVLMVTGSVSARGGDGGDNPQSPNITQNGGGGAGGRIFLEAPMPADVTVFDVRGGKGGLDCSPGAGPGQDGAFTVSMSPPPCLDLDGDGHSALGACDGADDCDDVDPNINPGASEVCDGVDNDCSGVAPDGGVATVDAGADGGGDAGADGGAALAPGVDTNDPNMVPCKSGQQCIDGQCREPGTDAGPPPKAAPNPFDIEYRGGCRISTVEETSATPIIVGIGALLGLAAALVLRARRAGRGARRPRRPGRT